MADHSYEDAPLWTVLSTLATMEGSEARVIDLARNVRTASGWAGAYRAIGRLIAAGYAVLDSGDLLAPSSAQGHRATVKLTTTGLARFRAGAGYVLVDQVDRVNSSGGFGAVHRRRWVLPRGKTR